MTVDLSPAEQAARAAAGIGLDAPLTEQEIAARTAERAQLLASVGATVAEAVAAVSLIATVAEAKGGAATLAALSAAEHDGRRAADEADHAKAMAMIEPLKTAGHAALTKFGALKAAHGDRVAKAASLDVRAILKRVPPKLVVGWTSRPTTSPSGSSSPWPASWPMSSAASGRSTSRIRFAPQSRAPIAARRRRSL